VRGSIPHQIADKVGLRDADDLVEMRHMSVYTAALIGEIVDFVGATGAKPFRGDDVKVFGQRRDVEFPADFGTAAEFTRMQQGDGRRAFVTCFEVMGVDPVYLDEMRLYIRHLLPHKIDLQAAASSRKRG
jgi:hypothetical protein